MLEKERKKKKTTRKTMFSSWAVYSIKGQAENGVHLKRVCFHTSDENAVIRAEFHCLLIIYLSNFIHQVYTKYTSNASTIKLQQYCTSYCFNRKSLLLGLCTMETGTSA